MVGRERGREGEERVSTPLRHGRRSTTEMPQRWVERQHSLSLLGFFFAFAFFPFFFSRAPDDVRVYGPRRREHQVDLASIRLHHRDAAAVPHGAVPRSAQHTTRPRDEWYESPRRAPLCFFSFGQKKRASSACVFWRLRSLHPSGLPLIQKGWKRPSDLQANVSQA